MTNTKLEVTWTLATVAIVAWVFVISYDTLQAIENPSEGTTELRVVASQWVWQFEYPDGSKAKAERSMVEALRGQGSVPTLYLEAGEPVRLVLTSTDVIHSFFVPEMGVKLDAVPGRENAIAFNPSEPGVYVGRCYEYCGLAHYAMLFQLVVFEPGAEGRELPYGPAPEAAQDDNETDNETEGREVEVSLTNFRITPATLQADAGEALALRVTNDGEGPHNFVFKSGPYEGHEDYIDAGDGVWVNFTADQEGTFTYICSVPGHEDLGMTGTLTVGEGGGDEDEDGDTPGFEALAVVLAFAVAAAVFVVARRR